MAKNTIQLSTKGFEEYIEKLDGLNADLQSIITDALEQAAETVQDDTLDALDKENLPAKGEYSQGDTEDSVIRNPKVKWSGTVAEIPVGFDFTKPGAGGLLISGTPRMQPATELNRIYRGKKYMRQIHNDMVDVFQDEIDRRMGG